MHFPCYFAAIQAQNSVCTGFSFQRNAVASKNKRFSDSMDTHLFLLSTCSNRSQRIFGFKKSIEQIFGNTNSYTIVMSTSIFERSPSLLGHACVYVYTYVRQPCVSKSFYLIQRNEIRYQIVVRSIVFDSNRLYKPYVLTNESECVSPTVQTICYWCNAVGSWTASIDTNNAVKRNRLTTHTGSIHSSQFNAGTTDQSEWG